MIGTLLYGDVGYGNSITPRQMSAVPEFRGNPGKLPDLIVTIIFIIVPIVGHFEVYNTEPNELR